MGKLLEIHDGSKTTSTRGSAACGFFWENSRRTAPRQGTLIGPLRTVGSTVEREV